MERLLCLIPLLLASLSAALAATVPAPAAKPNIVLILTDDMGWGDLSSFGNTEMATPNIDRLAKQGTRFTQFYVASPICSPSRVGYTTGCYPARWRINDYLHSSAGNQAHECANWLDPKAPTLARTLHEAGYATAHFGKWHMGGGRDVQDAPWPKAYGFDEHHVNIEGCGPRIDSYGSATPELVEGKMLARYEFTSFWVDKSLDFIRRHKDRPFFVELWPQDVHTPHDADPEEFPFVAATPAKHHKFNGVLRRYDREIGRMLDFLASEGLEQNTIVIFTGDNGPEPSFQRQRCGGLRGMKWSLYEGGIREPFLVRWPGHVPAGKTDATTVLASIDLYPTLCALAGIALPQELHIDGLDASTAFLGKPQPCGKPLLWEYGRQADYLFPREPGARSPNLAIRDGNWKLLINADATGTELYDLATDPNETKNLTLKRPEVVKQLQAAVLAWRKSLP
jgi:arylsulfatase A-like enzyme